MAGKNVLHMLNCNVVVRLQRIFMVRPVHKVMFY